MILSLSKIEAVNHFDFVNAGAEGKVTVSVSSAKLPFDSADWRVVASAQAFEGRQLVPCDLGSVDARYVKIDFDTHTAGSISGFNLFGMTVIGTRRVQRHLPRQPAHRADAKVDANFAYDPADPAPKVVADLGSASELKHLTCAYEAPAGHLDFYLVDEPPARASRCGRMNYVGEPTVQPVSNDTTATDDANVLAGHAGDLLGETADKAPGKVSADLKGLTGRYLVAAFPRRWSPRRLQGLQERPRRARTPRTARGPGVPGLHERARRFRQRAQQREPAPPAAARSARAARSFPVVARAVFSAWPPSVAGSFTPQYASTPVACCSVFRPGVQPRRRS